MSDVHVCSAAIPAAKPGHLRQVCGLCWFATDDCKCYAVDSVGSVMRESDGWSAWWGRDLMDRRYLGYHRTRREAVEAVRAMFAYAPHRVCGTCPHLPYCRSVEREKARGRVDETSVGL